MSAAKAVIIAGADGNALANAEATLHVGNAIDTFPLTNGDGYALSHLPWNAGSGYLKIVANGYLSYLQPLTIDGNNQNIFVGIHGTDPNAVILPPLQKAGSSFPNYPTRDEVCNIFCGFQGVTILTKQFGFIRAFGPEVGALNDEDTISYCQQMKALTFTHVEFAISWRYDEADFDYPVPGLDLAYDIAELARRMAICIRQGMFIKLSVSGDGMSVNDNPQQGQYNDPQGWTYGYQWAIQNLKRIITGLQTAYEKDLTRYTIFVPGYDAVFYGWSKQGEVPDQQPQRVINFGNLFRVILPDGYLGIEHSTGKIPVGESGKDWTTGGPLDAYDTLLSEFDPFKYHSDSLWQIVGRCYRPYNRPADQTPGDDLHPPYIIQASTRGKRFYIIYEMFTFRWVRNEISVAELDQEYDYTTDMAPGCTICMVRSMPRAA